MEGGGILILREHNVALRGALVTLRPLTESDWGLLARWNADPEVLWLCEGDDIGPRSLEEVQAIYRSVSRKAFCFVIELDGRPIGECWLQEMNLERILASHPGKDCRRIDLVIGEKDCWGKGLGTDVIRTLTRFGFEVERADLIFGLVYDHNPRSRRAFDKAGYVEDGRSQQPPGGKAGWLFEMMIGRRALTAPSSDEGPRGRCQTGRRMRLTGTVQGGKNDANRWLRKFAAVYESWLGQPIFPGSLNLDTGRPFDWHAPELLAHRRRFSLLPHGGERDLFMVPARIVRPGEQPCWLWTTTTAADDRDDPNVVELIAPVQLRRSLGLVDGSEVELVYPEAWLPD